jgi:hypothetical protein
VSSSKARVFGINTTDDKRVGVMGNGDSEWQENHDGGQQPYVLVFLFLTF